MALSFKVVRVGTDSSGRPIYMTQYMQEWFDAYVAECKRHGVPIVCVQGAFMSKVGGGGAKNSEGYHDDAGCLDLRSHNLTQEQKQFAVREARRRGAGAYLRDEEHGGMDEHIHLVLGPDKPKAPGASAQWAEYVAGGDGLVGNGKDYHWRPAPLVTHWSPPALAKTPNITAALSAKGREERKAALRLVINYGAPGAKKAAQSWLAAILTTEAATKKATAARKALKTYEAE